ncbi:RelA/SpoT family protein [Suttonella ornithocola]|uniref:guanosine-3',5'-bis(diphosphate) 3'-diphosphatase n=1 Tax=Suttonella ornithocola TaxID=279832 RepID=A0A380MKA7_9GAMM|nr:RelA/SpoT family protein [Suttonella ornithocola]SUO93060.1 Guanosine-3',5'-bis(diphosphate) 3'-pyrophosphohydrolase [Suttonella ornithocola]
MRIVALPYRPFAGLTGSEVLEAFWTELSKELSQYLDEESIAEVLRAATFGAQAHEGQMRQSGEPYFTHPISVTKILAEQRFDLPVLQAALLHDVLEDTPVTKQEMAEAFGDSVTALVDGVSKLDRLKNQAPQEAQAESFKKMFVATTDDPRVIIIKLADRLHNMQTLGALRPDKRIRKARETLEIYASIAGRLGLFYFRMQLEDLVFSYLYPWRYAVLKKHYTKLFENNTLLNEIREEIQPILKEMGIQATITKRQRHLWGVYQRMKRKMSFEAACHTVPIRIITKTEDDCYRILGVLHGLYRPISGKFEDYIAAPKSNGYRSLHTSVLMAEQDVLNVQIRTRDMHHLAETGIIAVWHQHLKNRSLRKEQHNITAQKYMRDWLSRLREMQNMTDDPLEFYDVIKKELSAGAIHVYTPRGEVIDLPAGATPVDFAYAINPEIGDKCVGAKVNGIPYPIFRPLEIAQTCEIITDKDAHPHAGWLQFVVTAKARAGVNHHLRQLKDKEAEDFGKQLLSQALQDLGSSYQAIENTKLLAYLSVNHLEQKELLNDIACGKKQAGLVAATLLGNTQIKGDGEVLYIHNTLDSGIEMADCCHPLPKEAIVGHLEQGKAIRIHRRNCPMVQVTDSQDWLRAAWDEDIGGVFIALLSLEVPDKPRMLSKIADVIADCESNIYDFQVIHNTHREDVRALKVWLEVKNRDHLAKIIRHLRWLEEVEKIERI